MADPKAAATDVSDHPWAASLREGVAGAFVSAKSFAGEVTIVVEREKIAEAARHFKEKEDFRYCVDVTAVDWRDRQPRFDVVYHLYSFSKNARVRIKTACGDGEDVPSIAPVYRAANWSEREVFDLYGIPFAGHPDLRRILTWDGFQGHPLRKDFPIEGIETGAAIYPEEWPVGAGPGPNDPNRKKVS